jgi:hypothetical protein
VLRDPRPGPQPAQHGSSVAARCARTSVTRRRREFVARGRSLVSRESSAQYYELCEQQFAWPEFAGASYSWGDALIADCADGSRDRVLTNLWRGAGTFHHRGRRAQARPVARGSCPVTAQIRETIARHDAERDASAELTPVAGTIATESRTTASRGELDDRPVIVDSTTRRHLGVVITAIPASGANRAAARDHDAYSS